MDHYRALGVPRSATQDEIKRAYRAKAHTLHPDRNKSPSAERRMKQINVAHDVLSDPAQRAEYDQLLQSSRVAPAPKRAPTAAKHWPESHDQGPVDRTEVSSERAESVAQGEAAKNDRRMKSGKTAFVTILSLLIVAALGVWMFLGLGISHRILGEIGVDSDSWPDVALLPAIFLVWLAPVYVPGYLVALVAMRLGLEETFEANVHHVFLQLLPLVQTEDFREGVRAFLEKRPAEFQGR